MAVEIILPPTDPFFKNAPFDWEGILFTTVADFEAYVMRPEVRAKLDGWADGATVHHTWKPTRAGWTLHNGRTNLMGLVKTWRDTNGWSTGPNLIIAREGIYLASGLDGPGIHAGVCNGKYVGAEVVGDYDDEYWQEPIRSFVFGAFVSLARAMRLTTDDIIVKKRINGHRECNSLKSCPGKAIDLDKFRKDVALLLPITAKTDATVIGTGPSVTMAQFKAYLQKYGAPLPPAEIERIYTLCVWLDIDPAFLAALWKQEAFVDDPTDNLPGRAIIGGSPLQRQTRGPLNIVEDANSTRKKIFYNNRWWRAYSTWQLGVMDSILYLKEKHGAEGRLTVRQIIATHSPATDGNNVDTIVTNILTRMAEMRTM